MRFGLWIGMLAIGGESLLKSTGFRQKSRYLMLHSDQSALMNTA